MLFFALYFIAEKQRITKNCHCNHIFSDMNQTAQSDIKMVSTQSDHFRSDLGNSILLHHPFMHQFLILFGHGLYFTIHKQR